MRLHPSRGAARLRLFAGAVRTRLRCNKARNSVAPPALRRPGTGLGERLLCALVLLAAVRLRVDSVVFAASLAPLHRLHCVVDTKRPFAGPEQVLRYLSRYTHRVAISNHRLVDVTDGHVTFTWKDYRHHGAAKVMRLAPGEFIRRFLLHTLPDGFHRIRHFGYLANGHRSERLALCRALLTKEARPTAPEDKRQPATELGATNDADFPVCFECGGLMRRVAGIPRGGQQPRPDTPPFRCDTS